MARNWYPVIDYEKCTGCITCYNFCPHEIYGVGANGKPMVVNPDNCVELRRGCQRICPAGAIRYYGEQWDYFYTFNLLLFGATYGERFFFERSNTES